MITESGVRILLSLGREGSILGSSTRDAAPLLSKSCARFRTPRPRRSSEATTSVPLRRTNFVFVLLSLRPTQLRPDTARMSSNHYDANGSAAFTQQQLTQKIGPYGCGDNCLLLRVNVLERDRVNLPDPHGPKDCKIRQHRHRNATQIFVPKMGLQALNLRHSRDKAACGIMAKVMPPAGPRRHSWIYGNALYVARPLQHGRQMPMRA